MLKTFFFFILSILFFSGSSTFAQASFDERLTTSGNIRMTINNLGMIGNAFRGSYNILDYPSCEFPVGSGVEQQDPVSFPPIRCGA